MPDREVAHLLAQLDMLSLRLARLEQLAPPPRRQQRHQADGLRWTEPIPTRLRRNDGLRYV